MEKSENYILNDFDCEVFNEVLTAVKSYDIYDFIARLSSLNLNIENQNKSPLIDYVIAKILSEDISQFQSTVIMSHGRFKNIVSKINKLNVKYSIDPAENMFSANVTLTKNYKVLNGINITPDYNLQMLIDVLFNYQNEFDETFKEEAFIFTTTMLEISDSIINMSCDSKSKRFPSDSKEIYVPSENIIKTNSDAIKICKDIIEKFELLFNDSCLIDFGKFRTGDSNNYNFFARPFLYIPNEDKVLFLNISLLPYFIISKLFLLADLYSLKNKVIERLNDYSFIKCKRYLSSMGHKKIKESSLKVDLVGTSYYKENLLSVYNNELMLLQFICDDGLDYDYNDIFSNYPDQNRFRILEERSSYFREKLNQNTNGLYILIVYNSIGRGFSILDNNGAFGYKPLFLSNFELMCIAINERKETNFLPKYIQAKSNLKFAPSLFGELSIISIYTSNDYSFYIDDDINPRQYTLYFDSGDILKYIDKAISSENKHLVKSYVNHWNTRIIYNDRMRNIYVEESPLEKDRFALCLELNNTLIWFTTCKFDSVLQIEILSQIVNLFSYWLSELKKLLNTIGINKDLLQINFALSDPIDEYRLVNVNKNDYDIYDIVNEDGVIQINISAKDFTRLNCSTNKIEKLYIKYLIDFITDYYTNKKTYDVDMFEKPFDNPKKKKAFAFILDDNPYYYPIKIESDRKIKKQDEDYLLDIIGEKMVKKEGLNIGPIPMDYATTFLNQIVEILFGMLEEEINKLDPNNLIEIIYSDLEEIMHEIKITERRYAYDVLCYPELQFDLIKYVNELNKSSIALKFLMEYVAAQPPKGDKILGIGNYEYILAICSSLIEWAYKNDLYYYDIYKTPIRILKSGRIGMKPQQIEELSGITEKFRNNQMFLNSLGTKEEFFEINKEKYRTELDQAFISEFGYSLEQLYILVYTLIELCQTSEDRNSVCTIKRKQLISYVRNKTELSENVIVTILDNLSLKKREMYLMEPREDIYPWRFNRSLSFLRRPIIIREEDCVFASRNLFHTYLYTVDLVFSGRLKSNNEKMKKLIGKISNERGKLFNDNVVKRLKIIEEFSVYENVKKVNKKKIEFEKGHFLGDIDVLFIDKEKRKIYVSEVKQFNFSRNPYEIHQEYLKMFVDSDKNKCFVTKHNLRVRWIKEHIKDLIVQYKLDGSSWKVIGLFIVDGFLISSKAYSKSINFITYDDISLTKIRNIK